MSILSIIIPHHNTPDLLKRCLDSIPTDKGIQVIAVDDNSDPSKVEFENFPGKERSDVEIYLTKEGRGAGYARNVGLQHAQGDWLLFADSDDFFFKGFYKTVARYFDSDADMVLFKANSVDSDTFEPSNRSEKMNGRIDKYYNGEMSALDVSLGTQVPWCRLIKRSFIETNNIRFDEVMASNDTMFTTKASCLAKSIDVCKEVIYVVTHRQGSLWDSRKSSQNYLTRLEVQIRRNKYLKSQGLHQLPIIGYVVKGMSINIKTFLKALYMAISKGALFQGVSYYMKK